MALKTIKKPFLNSPSPYKANKNTLKETASKTKVLFTDHSRSTFLSSRRLSSPHTSRSLEIPTTMGINENVLTF